jgi:hypothetical protein
MCALSLRGSECLFNMRDLPALQTSIWRFGSARPSFLFLLSFRFIFIVLVRPLLFSFFSCVSCCCRGLLLYSFFSAAVLVCHAMRMRVRMRHPPRVCPLSPNGLCSYFVCAEDSALHPSSGEKVFHERAFWGAWIINTRRQE